MFFITSDDVTKESTSDVLKKAKVGNGIEVYPASVSEDNESQALQSAMEPRLYQVSYGFNCRGELPSRTQNYKRNSLIFATKLVSSDEFRNLAFTFSSADGKAPVQTRRFAREQFHKVQDATGVEVMLKMAAMAEIRNAHDRNEQCRLSVTHQLICKESSLVKIQKNHKTGKVYESTIKIDGLQPSRIDEPL